MEILFALRSPAGSEELAISGLGLHSRVARVVEAAVAQHKLQRTGKHILCPIRRTPSDRRPKLAVAEAGLTVLVMIHRHVQRVCPSLTLRNHLSPVGLGQSCNPWMTEYTVFSVEGAACRCHLGPQLRLLLRPVTSTSGM